MNTYVALIQSELKTYGLNPFEWLPRQTVKARPTVGSVPKIPYSIEFQNADDDSLRLAVQVRSLRLVSSAATLGTSRLSKLKQKSRSNNFSETSGYARVRLIDDVTLYVV